MITQVNANALWADIVVQNQVPRTPTDQGNKTDGQHKPNETIPGSALDPSNLNASTANIYMVVYGIARNFKQMDRGPRNKSMSMDYFFQSHKRK